MNGFYTIAIDGPSGAGKSSLARRLAGMFQFIYVDTGAIYRTVGLAAYRAGIDRRDEAAVSAEIRLAEISICASDVAARPAVRDYLLEMQRKLARENHVIMDGRDIGTVVLPEAELKVFLTASAEARARRRLLELESKGVSSSFEEVLKDIEYRDVQDSSRAAAPLKAAEDAVLVDTSELDFEQSLALLAELVATRLAPEGAREK